MINLENVGGLQNSDFQHRHSSDHCQLPDRISSMLWVLQEEVNRKQFQCFISCWCDDDILLVELRSPQIRSFNTTCQWCWSRQAFKSDSSYKEDSSCNLHLATIKGLLLLLRWFESSCQFSSLCMFYVFTCSHQKKWRPSKELFWLQSLLFVSIFTFKQSRTLRSPCWGWVRKHKF